MFQALMPYLQKVDMNLTLSATEDGKIVFAINPRVKDGGKTLDIIPLVGSGSPEALDAQLPTILQNGLGQKLEVIVNIADFQKSADNKNKSNAKSSTPNTSSSSKPAEPAKAAEPKVPTIKEPPKTNKAEHKAYTELQTMLASAKEKVHDVDMHNFWRKEIHKKGALIKSQKDIKEAIDYTMDQQRKDYEAKQATLVEDKGTLFEASSSETQAESNTHEPLDANVKVVNKKGTSATKKVPNTAPEGETPEEKDEREATLRQQHEDRARKAQETNKEATPGFEIADSSDDVSDEEEEDNEEVEVDEQEELDEATAVNQMNDDDDDTDEDEDAAEEDEDDEEPTTTAVSNDDVDDIW